MNDKPDFIISDKWITSKRGNKNHVDPEKPYSWLVEKELTHKRKVEDVAIIFLTNRECPFHCLMCDLWKNTTDVSVIEGAISDQIEWGLENMPSAKHLKLYNSGSFFDRNAINVKEFKRIASIIRDFETVIVESHPNLIDHKCLEFRDLLRPELHIAMGLETIQPGMLKKINKKMIPDDFKRSVSFLSQHEILTRAFILLKLPFQTESEGKYWAKRSLEFAFTSGVECCTVIPVRSGNGAMDILEEKELFSPPDITSLEEVLEYGIGLNAGRVFADTWDLEKFSKCSSCFDQRKNRLVEINLTQKISPEIKCRCKLGFC